MIRRLARGAVAFLDWLDAHNRTLGSCQQADLDRWLADEQAVYREEADRLVCCARSFANQAGRIEADPARHWRPTAIVRPGSLLEIEIEEVESDGGPVGRHVRA